MENMQILWLYSTRIKSLDTKTALLYLQVKGDYESCHNDEGSQNGHNRGDCVPTQA